MLSKFSKKYVILLAIAVFSASCRASLQDKISQILARKDQAKVKFGILVIEPNSHKLIYNYNETLPLICASNMKLVTTFTALKTLGQSFQFVTTAGISGKNLVIIGSGDPLLGFAPENAPPNNAFLLDIIKAVKDRNITEIEDIVIDSSIFDNVMTHPDWPKEQLNRPYESQVSGLNYNANCIKILASQKDNQVALQLEPDTSFLTLINKVLPTNKGESALGTFRTEKENVIIVSGKCRKPASFDVAIERPPAFFACLLAENLSKAGVKISGRTTFADASPRDLQVLVEHRTGILDAIRQCNKDSFQLAAECLSKTLAAKQNGGRGGSWQGGQKVVTDYLESLGADKSGFYIDDGSGLSSQNRLSAEIIVKVLSDAYSSNLWPVFKETLAAGGIDGTLRKYFYQNKYRGKVLAKTGYINGVRALSGTCISDKGGEYIFSILTNDANYNTKIAIFDIVKAIIDEG